MLKPHLPLAGIRVHLSGSIPDESNEIQRAGIISFVEKFAAKVLAEGGSVIHGSHPTLVPSLRVAGSAFVQAGGDRGALTLVRAEKFLTTEEHHSEVAQQREFATVQVLPSTGGSLDEPLVPMREWMAEQSDVIVILGGRWWKQNRSNSGVVDELQEALYRGQPAFLLGGFGGAAAGYAESSPEMIARLKNGLSREDNQALVTENSPNLIVERITEQIARLPLVRQNMPTGRNFRILALDGGGLRGTFTAAVLAKWDDMLGSGGNNNLVGHFDLVAGTSTGAILAIGLGLGLTPLQMLDFYRERGPLIFPPNRILRHWLRSKHESATLRELLEGVFGTKTLSGDSCCRLVIPTVRAKHGEAESIVTAHSEDRTAFRDISAVDAALASSAAPSYFDESSWDSPIATTSYLDGGIWANNPVLPAIAEAVRHLKIPLDRIDVLSVGTMGSEEDFTTSLGKGKLGWAPSSADLFFAAQEYAAQTIADSLLSPVRHLRVNQITPSKIKLDDTEAINDMASRGKSRGEDTFIQVRSRFFDGSYVADWRP